MNVVFIVYISMGTNLAFEPIEMIQPFGGAMQDASVIEANVMQPCEQNLLTAMKWSK